MKVRMLTVISGTIDGQPYPAVGGELEVPDAAGADLCANGYAEPVAAPTRAEKATAEAPRRAAKKA